MYGSLTPWRFACLPVRVGVGARVLSSRPLFDVIIPLWASRIASPQNSNITHHYGVLVFPRVATQGLEQAKVKETAKTERSVEDVRRKGKKIEEQGQKKKKVVVASRGGDNAPRNPSWNSRVQGSLSEGTAPSSTWQLRRFFLSFFIPFFPFGWCRLCCMLHTDAVFSEVPGTPCPWKRRDGKLGKGC